MQEISSKLEKTLYNPFDHHCYSKHGVHQTTTHLSYNIDLWLSLKHCQKHIIEWVGAVGPRNLTIESMSEVH